MIHRLADLVDANAKELAWLETVNSGKILDDSMGDVSGVVSCLRYYAGLFGTHHQQIWDRVVDAQ
jgi:acyl-CoA reductase-like NAD-dependent aldehyde dehydrogenase